MPKGATITDVLDPATLAPAKDKAPASIVSQWRFDPDTGKLEIPIWGDGNQTRSFMFIDDCLKGIDYITHCEELNATPISLPKRHCTTAR